jgi:sec-independent protein translocase protein TatA
MLPGIPSLGGAELLIVLAIILLLFGAKRIPTLGRSLGSGIKEFRQGLAEGDNEEEVQDPKKKRRQDEEEPSLNGAAAHTEVSHEEETTPRTEQKNS